MDVPSLNFPWVAAGGDGRTEVNVDFEKS